MKTMFSILMLLLIFSTVNAQPTKVDKTLGKIDEKTRQFEQVQNAGAKLKGLFGGKKDKESKVAKDSAGTAGKASEATVSVPVSGSGGKTVISITGIDYPKLKVLNENIRNCKGVQSSKMAFDVATSQIEVAHSGSTEDLIKIVGEISKDIFTEKNITGLSEGKVSLKL